MRMSRAEELATIARTREVTEKVHDDELAVLWYELAHGVDVVEARVQGHEKIIDLLEPSPQGYHCHPVVLAALERVVEERGLV